MAQIIQGPPTRNTAENKILDWLRELPDGYYVFRELRVTPTFEDRVRGLQEKRPDFVVVGPNVGVVSIEVKHWNLVNNVYEWRDQYTVLKKSVSGDPNEEEHPDNPYFQAAEYLHALGELLKSDQFRVWITSLVAFPTNTKSGFLNRFGNKTDLTAPQGRFYLDWEATLFSDNLDDSPEMQLGQRAKSRAGFKPINSATVEQIVNVLLPPTYRLGDDRIVQSARQTLNRISKKQEEWIFDHDLQAAYLVDVAGSGKTTALLSKAIHLYQVAKRQHQTPPQTLITTYSEPLANNLREMHANKMGQEEKAAREFIRIESIPQIKRWIVVPALYSEAEFQAKYVEEQNSKLEAELNDDVLLTLKDQPERFRSFDYLFVDEIQDCSDDDIAILRYLIRDPNHFFFVGDVGQRIFEREHHITRHVQQVNAIELDLSFRMYRTPRFIARLALSFVARDPDIAREFQNHGYKLEAEYRSPFENGAELIHSARLETELIDTLERYLQRFRLDDVLIISSEAKLAALQKALEASGIPVWERTKLLPRTVKLVEFSSSKGLEAPVVFICGIEDLPHRHRASPFNLVDERMADEQRSRRLIYVALTRAIEECLLFYEEPSHPFIQELRQIQDSLSKQRLQS